MDVDLGQQYTTLRGSNAIPVDSLHPINDASASQPCSHFGVHPSMTALASAYNDGDALFVANVGPLVEPVDKTRLAQGARRPPSLYSHNSQKLTAMNVHAQVMGW